MVEDGIQVLDLFFEMNSYTPCNLEHSESLSERLLLMVIVFHFAFLFPSFFSFLLNFLFFSLLSKCTKGLNKHYARAYHVVFILYKD